MEDEDLEGYGDQLTEIAAENERLQLEAADAQARIGQLTENLANARKELEEARAAAASIEDGYRRAVDEYRTALLAIHSDVPQELIRGGSVEEVQESLKTARGMVQQVRERLAEESAGGGARVPPGAPIRRGPDVDSLSARQKIAEGLRRND